MMLIELELSRRHPLELCPTRTGECHRRDVGDLVRLGDQEEVHKLPRLEGRHHSAVEGGESQVRGDGVGVLTEVAFFLGELFHHLPVPHQIAVGERRPLTLADVALELLMGHTVELPVADPAPDVV